MTFRLAARPSAPKTPTRSIVFLAFAGFASQAQVRVTDSLLPQIAADLGTSVGLASIVVTGYVIAHGSTQLLIGPIGDRFGKYLTIAVMAMAAAMFVILRPHPIAGAACRRSLPRRRMCRVGDPALDGLCG
jgi:MFS family permease